MRAYFTGGGPLNGRYGEVPDNQETFAVDDFSGQETMLRSVEHPGEVVAVKKAIYRKTGDKVARIYIFRLENSNG